MRLNTAAKAVIGSVVFAVLLAGWAYLYMQSHAVSADERNELLSMVRTVKQADSDWTADVLRAHTDLHLNYDTLAKPLRPFAEALATLRQRIGHFGSPQLEKHLADLAEALQTKTTLVDSFKAQNSLFKNSLRYVPTAHRDIETRMRSEREAGMSAQDAAARGTKQALDELEKSLAGSGSAETAESRRRVHQALSNMRSTATLRDSTRKAPGPAAMMELNSSVGLLVDEVLRYSSVPDRDSATVIRAEIARLRVASSTNPLAVRESVDNLLTHLETLLRLRTRQTDLLRDISAVPVGARADSLSGAITARADAALADQYRYQRYLLGYSGLVLLLVLAGAGFMLHSNAAERRRLRKLVDRQTAALKETEMQIVHAQRMATVGEMVACIAHEVNTPLAALKSSLKSAREQLSPVRQKLSEDDSRPLGTVGEVLDSGAHCIDRVLGVVLNLLNFSRLDHTRVTFSKVEEGLDATLAIARHLLRSIKLHKHYGETQPIHCDMSQINQVVLNLVKNAAQAVSAQHGEIHITTRMQGLSQVRIEVRDNGRGIAPEVISRIWEPFFSTRPAGQGTGLGLSTCRKIVHAHGGSMTVTSQLGRGSIFAVTLPVTPPTSLYQSSGQEPLERLEAA